MEEFNSKLYDKYQNLKKRKLIDEAELAKKMIEEIKSYQLGVDDQIGELKSENNRLRSEIIALKQKYHESQKLLLEEGRKANQLSKEVGKLTNILVQKNDNVNSASPRSHKGPKSRLMNTYKGSSKTKTPISCAIQSDVQHKEVTSIPCAIPQQDQNVPVCCQKNATNSGDAISEGLQAWAFQTLLEYLFNMKLSLELQADKLCILAKHQRSGYTFTLTWSRREDGADGEMWYRVSTLGTLDRIAHKWMKEEICFSMTMFPVFFQRVKQVLGYS